MVVIGARSMATVGKQGFPSRRRFSLLRVMAFCLIAAAIWVLINMRNLQEFLDTYYKRNQELEQIELLKQQIRTLEKQQRSLRYNGIEAEKQVRQKWGMHLPGEKVIFLKPESDLNQTTAPAWQDTRTTNTARR